MSTIAAGTQSMDFLISQAQTYGVWTRLYNYSISSSTAATVTSGGVGVKRLPAPMIVPTLGSGITGAWFPQIRMMNGTATNSIMAGLEYLLITMRYVNITMTADAGTDFLTVTAHGCANNDWVRFTTSGTLPAPLATGTDYYVVNKTTNTFQVATTSGGSPIDITNTGSGTHTCNYAVTPGVAMPTKTIKGTSVTTAASACYLVATVAVTATTPTITITYTDQDGNTENSCAPVLPSSPSINSGFWLGPQLASGDTAVRAVTNIVPSAGTAGTLKVYGVLPLAYATQGGSNSLGSPTPISTPYVPYLATSGEAITFYSFAQTGNNSQVVAVITGVGDN